MYISSVAQPVNQPDALRLLLDRILGGADVTLISEGDGGRVLLDLAADCLAELRSRILRAAEVLPGTLGVPMPPPHMAGQSKAGVPDDELLTRGFQALTVLDQTCDRIVLLVSDAHALQYPALRYIQFVSRSGAPLQFVFCGTHRFFDQLNVEEFGWLRVRLMAGLVVTLAAPIAEASDMSPGFPSVPKDPEAWVEDTAAPLPGIGKSAVSASTSSWILRLGALALLGLGGVACLMLSMQNGEADGPAVSRQAATVIQPSRPPESPAMSAPATQVSGGNASHSDSEASAAAPDVPAPHSPVMGSDVQGAGPGSASIVPLTPLSTAASNASITIWSQTKAGVPESESNASRLPEPLPGPARNLGQQSASAVPSRTVGAASGSRARRLKEARDQSAPLPAGGDHWLEPQPAFNSREPPDGRSPRYIGSYATDANGVRMFHLEP